MKIASILEYRDEDELFEMSNITPKRSGLQVSVWVREKNEGLQHGCSIKVSNIAGKFSPDNFSVSVTQNPKVIAGKCKLKKVVLDDIIDWVKLNRRPLLDLWESKIDIGEFLEKMKKL